MRSLGFRAADLVEIEHQPPHRGIGLHLAAVLRRTAACQIGRRHIDPTVVGPLEPDAGTQLRILVERIDQIVERDRIVARTDAVEDETEPRRIAQPRDADERVGVERAAERAARDVVDRIQKTAGNELMNIITIFLGFSVGCTTNAATFLNIQTVEIIVLGIVAFGVGTAGGVLLGKVMCVVTHGKINPLIGSAGVSAVPMAARVSQKVGQEYNPRNYLLMHAMGPNVAGVIGSAVAAGILINMFG